MTALFWDIDGTLIFTGKAGMLAWQDATVEVTKAPLDLTGFSTAGVTDFAIARKILQNAGEDPDAARIEALVRRYEAHLPASLPKRQGRVLAGVREALDAMKARGDVRQFLLTGNTRAGAQAKLTHYGLWDYFEDGAFSEDSRDRADIAREAIACATRRGPVTAGRAYVIGDTPHDIHCGRAIGVRTVAVASGEYTVDELREHDPWHVLPGIPAPDEFMSLLEIPGVRVLL
jgi:phosphoglycolate phosphatase-like HAD superfamily hydrolase